MLEDINNLDDYYKNEINENNDLKNDKKNEDKPFYLVISLILIAILVLGILFFKNKKL
jgi:uncharacterized protein YqhQ